MVKFFICERIPSENRGEAAILEGLVAGLDKVFGDYQLSIYTMRPKQDSSYYANYGDVVFLGKNNYFQRFLLLLQLVLYAIFYKFGIKCKFESKIFKTFESADVLIQGHDNVYRHGIKFKDFIP